jgi:uncharacterized protein YbbK (DUF523 family)
VSSCLLGERVRYDGKEKGDSWIAEVLASQVEIVSICPEVGAGMPVPRPAIQVVEESGRALRLQVVGDGRDVTEAMQVFIDSQIQSLRARPLDGYILKARSPSCGLRDTPYFVSAARSDQPSRIASGVWAASLRDHFGDLHLADESELQDPPGRERFLEEVQKRWRARTTRP